VSETIFTHDTGNYANKLCKCYVCGTVRRATFDFDYYSMADDQKVGGPTPLMCERCMMKKAFGTPNPPTTIIHPNGEVEERDGEEEEEV
jgi:hypothetical protein